MKMKVVTVSMQMVMRRNTNVKNVKKIKRTRERGLSHAHRACRKASIKYRVNNTKVSFENTNDKKKNHQLFHESKD